MPNYVKNLVLACSVIFTVLPATAYEGGENIIRLGYANLDFREDSGVVQLNNSISLGKLSVESQQKPIVSFAKMFNKHWGIEVFIPFKALELKAGGKGGFINDLPMGSADVSPVYVTAQYYPFNTTWAKPYIGAGLNYVFISNEKINTASATSLGVSNVESINADNSFGVVLQAGVDIPVSESLLINISTTYLDMNLEAEGIVISAGARSNISAKMGIHTQPNFTTIGISYAF